MSRARARVTLLGLMAPDPVYGLERLELLWLLSSDATPIERLLAHQPLTGSGHRHRTMLLTRWGRAAGLDRYQP